MSRFDDEDYDDRPRPRPRRRDDDDDFDRPRRRAADGSNGLAVVGLVLGVVSLCTGCVSGIPAIIVSVVAMKRPVGKGMATAGLVLGVLGSFMTIILVALLLPAVQKVRDAAARAKDSGNLKAIAVAAHNYNDVNRTLPPATGDLSWRVHILPFIEQQNLHSRFDLDQPWDGPANRQLADVRVQTYVSANDPADFTQTRFRVFTGPGTLYDPGRKPFRIPDIPDGTSNTLFVVEAEDAVPWPQPKELPYTPNGPLPPLGRQGRNVILVVMADGSVQAVSKTVDEAVIRAAITPAGRDAFGGW